VRLAEKLQEPVLLRRFVVTPRDGEPDLGVKGDGPDRLLSHILHAQLEEERRNGGELLNLYALYTKVQIRHKKTPPVLIADRWR
jgi:hypothetical protein